MKRATIRVPAAGLLACLLGLAASCGAAKEEPVSVPPVATATAAAAPSAAPRASTVDPADVNVASWTDDEVILALAMDCHWDPGDCVKAIEAIALQSVDNVEFAPEGGAAPSGDTRVLPAAACQGLQPLACASVPGQSCAPDECSQTDYDCIPECDKSCGSCASKCVTGCESCKSTCKDEACRLTCATSCAECRQGCLKTLDNCASAHCSEVGETCFKERDDQWNASACPKVCPKVQTCVEKCPEVENDYTGSLMYQTECAVKCLTKLGKGCPERFKNICLGDPNASVNFNVYHSTREAGGN